MKTMCSFFKIEVLLSGKLHEDGDCSDNDEVKDGEFVHLLAHTGLPTLMTLTSR